MNLVQEAVERGGKLSPIIISGLLTNGTGLMNPSIFIDADGDILCILRHVNYTLYHSENTQKFPSRWGPLSYLHPEKDQTLRTINYLCRLDKNMKVTDSCVIDTSDLDVPPLWEFIGEEDCRLVQWEGKYYAIGVRRDTTTNGQGRMELSEIEIDKENFSAKEVSRKRIPAPGANTSYCEKNWMPILDKPYQFVKWTMPTEVVQAYPDKDQCDSLLVKEGFRTNSDQRGGSHIVPWGDYYLAVTHEVRLFKNYLKQKDGIYRHRLIVWDKEFNIVGVSPKEFAFLDARIEFVAGAAKYEDDLLLSFGFQDNAAFVLRTPGGLIEKMITEAIAHVKN